MAGLSLSRFVPKRLARGGRGLVWARAAPCLVPDGGATMSKAARSFLNAIALLLLVTTFGWAGPYDDFKVGTSALDRGDYTTAVEIFRSLAAQGVDGAQWALGAMYLEGRGVPRDYAMALMLHRQAAEQGHPLSQFDLGNMYDLGLGVSEDRAEAFKWFRRSAEQGYGDAQVNLGAMYYRGEGTAQDYVEAYKWFSIAAAGGGYLDTRGNVAGKIDATRRRDILARQMTPAQIAEAQDRALQWKPRPERAP